MDSIEIEKIKRLTVAALVSDDLLMGILVLKGGNALNIVYDISNRGSVDIDFSMETDFTSEEKGRLRNELDSILNREFSNMGYKVFDVKFEERPNVIEEAVKEFWGGYLLKFKLINQEKYDSLDGEIESVRRNALQVGKNQSTNFTVDISKYEYVGGNKSVDMEGSVLHVYTPEMIVLEKVRAICQQIPEYKDVVFRMKSSPRARDFYDIHSLCTHFNLDFTTEENIDLIQVIFEAKKVPLNYISKIEEQYELHFQDWESVLQTIDQEESVQDFDYYFNFVINLFQHI